MSLYEFHITAQYTGEPMVIRGSHKLVEFLKRCSGYNLHESDTEEYYRYKNLPRTIRED